jgi:hypothetical protein
MENITIFIICCLLSCCIILSVVGGILLTKPKPKPKKKQEKTEKEETEKEETTQQPSTQTTTQITQQPSTQTTTPPSTQTTTPPSTQTTTQPSAPSNYFLHGPWIDYNTSFRKVGEIKKIGTENVYLIQDGDTTKMVTDSGVGKYYGGKIQDFDSSKWDTYNKTPEKSYILRLCPSNCTNGCSGDNNKVCSSSPYLPARYIRLQRTDGKDEAINLTEIEVYNQLGQKITTGITPSLNPQYGSADVFGPQFLIDGKSAIDTNVAHTTASKDAYVQLDLGADIMISKIIIKNRLNCCKERIIGTSLILQNNSITEIYRKAIDKQQDEYTFTF